MLEGFRGLHSQSRLLRFLAILAVVPHAHIFLETATDSVMMMMMMMRVVICGEGQR